MPSATSIACARYHANQQAERGAPTLGAMAYINGPFGGLAAVKEGLANNRQATPLCTSTHEDNGQLDANEHAGTRKTGRFARGNGEDDTTATGHI
jgi:hypothetical protein